MPKGNVDYSKGLIYKLCCKDPNIKEIYIGSTTNFRCRKRDHKQSCCNPKDKEYNLKKYIFIREHGGWENWEMILVEYYNATDRLDLRKRERYWYDELSANLNSAKPYISAEELIEINKVYSKENYKKNKEKRRIYKKEYYENNKEEINIQKKEYRKKNKEKISIKMKEYYEDKKEQILKQKKEYYEDKKEEILEKNKKYYENNKEEINKKRYNKKVKMNCDCGTDLFKHNYNNHLKSKKHIKWFNNNS